MYTHEQLYDMKEWGRVVINGLEKEGSYEIEYEIYFLGWLIYLGLTQAQVGPLS